MTKLQRIWKATLQRLAPTPANIGRLLMVSWLIAAMIALSALQGCSYLETPQRIPASLRVACAPVAPFEGSTLRHLMIYTADTLQQYHECKARHDAVIVWANRV